MSLLDVESVLDERIDSYDLEIFRDNYLKQCTRGSPCAEVVFAYASALIRSSKTDVREGVDILENLVKNESRESNQRDYIYYLSLGYARLSDYDRALAYIDILLKSEKENRQVSELKEIIEKKMRKDGFIGAAIVGGALAVVAGGLFAIMKAVKN
ncbi:unnamed protein product [Auanema sp. JU1783]|nr:unnamed protein product [Auanema sp. JU1783]